MNDDVVSREENNRKLLSIIDKINRLDSSLKSFERKVFNSVNIDNKNIVNEDVSVILNNNKDIIEKIDYIIKDI